MSISRSAALLGAAAVAATGAVPIAAVAAAPEEQQFLAACRKLQMVIRQMSGRDRALAQDLLRCLAGETQS